VTAASAVEPSSHDRDQEEGDDPMDEIRAFIEANMQPEAFAQLQEMMKAAQGNSGENNRADPEFNPLPKARDNPPSFTGRPNAGGRLSGRDNGASSLLPRASGYRTVPKEDVREIRNNFASDSRSNDDYFRTFGNRHVGFVAGGENPRLSGVQPRHVTPCHDR